MKKKLAIALVFACTMMSVSVYAESAQPVEAAAEAVEAAEDTAAPAEEAAAPAAKSEGVMTYEEYMAAEMDTEVVIEAYVQAKQSWWEDEQGPKATIYAQDEDGAYFLYNAVVTQEDYEKLEVGTKFKATGYKSEWSGEIEITEAVIEIEEGSFTAEAFDATALLGTDDLIAHQNEKVSFKGMTVEPAQEGSDAAYLYSYDGSGSEGDDLYFNVSVNGAVYTFTVESYLCDSSSDVYKAVKELKVGDVIDLEGFLYWYEGANPHITSVKAAQ